jgi:hypothetical protein
MFLTHNFTKNVISYILHNMSKKVYINLKISGMTVLTVIMSQCKCGNRWNLGW